MNRRKFFGALVALVVAPALPLSVAAERLTSFSMPIRIDQVRQGMVAGLVVPQAELNRKRSLFLDRLTTG